MCEVHQRGCEFDDNARQEILKCNVENGDCKDDSFSDDGEGSLERRYGSLMWKRPKSSEEEESCRNRNDLVPYVNHDVSDFDSKELSSDEEEWRFSCEEQKRCRRIVCSKIKIFLENCVGKARMLIRVGKM